MRSSEYRKMYEAETGHWWYVALHDLIIASLPDKPGLRILDAGCGTGGLLRRMPRHGSASGCDASHDALDFCARRGLNVFKTDLNTGIFAEADYDVITLIDVLYHRNIDDDGEVLRKIFFALNPGGRLILQVPAYEWLRSSHDEAVHTARRYSRKKIILMLNSCGFAVEKATYRVTLLFIPVALKRLMQKIAGRPGKGSVPASDVKRHSPFINAVLYAAMKAENALLKHFSLPFGISVFAVARRPGLPEMLRGSK